MESSKLEIAMHIENNVWRTVIKGEKRKKFGCLGAWYLSSVIEKNNLSRHWTPKQHNKTAQPKADMCPASHFSLFNCEKLSWCLKKGITPKIRMLCFVIINTFFLTFHVFLWRSRALMLPQTSTWTAHAAMCVMLVSILLFYLWFLPTLSAFVGADKQSAAPGWKHQQPHDARAGTDGFLSGAVRLRLHW